MKEFYTPETFDPEKYKKSGWTVSLSRLEMDQGNLRLIVRVATGRKYWCLFTVLPDFELGLEDPVLKEIKFSLNSYTHFMIDRFIDELNVALNDLYQIRFDLREIQSGITKIGYSSTRNY